MNAWDRSKHLTCAETARLVRAAVKGAFPGVKFSVTTKTYSGGASIRVSWVDGPTSKEVGRVAGPFAGSGFDGMIDLKYYVTTWLLPDGSAVVANTTGTGGNGGSNPAIHNEKPHPDAVEVQFGADFVFCNRESSMALLQQAAARVAEHWGVPVPQLTPSGVGGYVAREHDFRVKDYEFVSHLVYQEANATPA